jgi:hypothetical protein
MHLVETAFEVTRNAQPEGLKRGLGTRFGGRREGGC